MRPQPDEAKVAREARLLDLIARLVHKLWIRVIGAI